MENRLLISPNSPEEYRLSFTNSGAFFWLLMCLSTILSLILLSLLKLWRIHTYSHTRSWSEANPSKQLSKWNIQQQTQLTNQKQFSRFVSFYLTFFHSKHSYQTIIKHSFSEAGCWETRPKAKCASISFSFSRSCRGSRVSSHVRAVTVFNNKNVWQRDFCVCYSERCCLK